MEYIFDRNTINDLLEILEDNDIVRMTGSELRSLVVKGGTMPKGRKPIEVDVALFDETVALWKSGRITARQAMERLNLKPNTFYRRIKERSISEMKDIRSEIKETLKEDKKELKKLKKQVREEAKELKNIADDKVEKAISLHRMEKDIHHEKIAAEIEQKHIERELRETVAKERNEQKELSGIQ